MKSEENLKSPAPTKTDNKLFSIRPAVEADVPFIFNSWLKSHRNSATHVSNAVYFQFHHKLIEAVLQRSQVQVMHQADDSNEILGYICYEVLEGIVVVHYVYIKNSFRKLGLFTHLVSSAGITTSSSGFYTHDTPAARRLVQRQYKGFVFNPYLLHKAD